MRAAPFLASSRLVLLLVERLELLLEEDNTVNTVPPAAILEFVPPCRPMAARLWLMISSSSPYFIIPHTRYAALHHMARLGFMKNPGEASSGVYKVMLYHRDRGVGSWRPMYVDDRVPALNKYDEGLLSYGQVSGQRLATAVSVKALTKIYGNLEAMEKGAVPEAICGRT